MLSPEQQQALAAELLRIYADAETEILQKVARRLARGIEQEGWAERKLAEIQKLRRELQIILAGLEKQGGKAVDEIVQKAYEAGSEAAAKDLRKLEAEFKTGFGEVHENAVKALAGEAKQLLVSTHMQILRKSVDVYRSVVVETIGRAVTGVQTRREVAQAALTLFVDRGISGFTDAKGRKWEMATYAEMATRTALANAQVEGHINRMVENGRDLVIVSDHARECSLCRPFEGRILSITGKTSGYTTVAQARSAGLFHPNCGHRLSAYIPGMTTPRGAADPEGYEAKQKQRYIERQIRRWKRREIAAITDQERQKARAKVREWQAKQREHLEGTGLRRKYERESIARAR